MQIDSILACLLKKGTGECSYRFSNADGKTWIMPTRNMRIAMHLYQPSGRNGKLVKALFPWLHGMPFVRKVIHAERLRCKLSGKLEQLLCRLFHEEEIEFSIFGGTPCVHQKVTIQISKGCRILGYCKVTDSHEVAALFRSEADLLEHLKRQGMEGVPQALFCGELMEGVFLFVQNTTKTRQSKVLHEWSNLHEHFLNELQRKTVQNITFEKSDYYRVVQGLQSHMDWLPEFMNRNVIEKMINKIVNSYKGQVVDFSAYHADFTPWNMFVEKNRLFVFDWEYTRTTYPPMLDRYHFFTQTAIFEKHWQGKEVIAFLQSPNADWVNKERYTLYLLDIISRFTVREKGTIEGDIAHSMKIWNDLLVYLNK